MHTWHRNTFTIPSPLQFDQPVQFSQKTVKLNDGFFVQPNAKPNRVGPLAKPQKIKNLTPLTAFKRLFMSAEHRINLPGLYRTGNMLSYIQQLRPQPIT
jgi:hypothetical protein